MEIPSNILNILKCSQCESYLTRSPVYLQHDGEAVCATCYSPKRPAIRNKQYEATAKLLQFPCRNQDLGCLKKVSFDGVEAHEEVCEYRQYICPILGSFRCEWVGYLADILEHCEKKHADSIKNNPVVLIHDIAKSNEQNFLVRAFQVLFLLHTKVCITSGKIFHAIRYLGRSDEAKKYTFIEDIIRDVEHVKKSGRVINQGCLSIQEDTSLVLKVNSLLDMLGGFNGTTFTITLKELVTEKCIKCKSSVITFDFHEQGGWWCNACSPAKKQCSNATYGCNYYDVAAKCIKHRSLFCEYGIYCLICRRTIGQVPLIHHYNSTHQKNIIKAGTKFRIMKDKADLFYNLSCVAGIAMCGFKKFSKNIDFFVALPVPNNRLREFKCSVRVVQVSTGQIRNYSSDPEYNESYDWCIEITPADFPSWSNEFDIIVNIFKVEP